MNNDKPNREIRSLHNKLLPLNSFVQYNLLFKYKATAAAEQKKKKKLKHC